MAEFTRFSETILTKQDQRVVSITVKPMISDCTGRIYFTDLMVQEGDRLTGYVIKGGGYGHGVGLSQNGAKGMAEAGMGYQEILAYFYQDVELADISSIL